jgi:hypothetical protein
MGVGGFFPSAMGSILQSGPIFMTASAVQARRLIVNEKERMASRKRSRRRNRKHSKKRRVTRGKRPNA